MMEFVDYLKNPSKFTALGARIPKVGVCVRNIVDLVIFKSLDCITGAVTGLYIRFSILVGHFVLATQGLLGRCTLVMQIMS